MYFDDYHYNIVHLPNSVMKIRENNSFYDFDEFPLDFMRELLCRA